MHLVVPSNNGGHSDFESSACLWFILQIMYFQAPSTFDAQFSQNESISINSWQDKPGEFKLPFLKSIVTKNETFTLLLPWL